MTRQEFIDSINDFGYLIDFCYDNVCYIMEEVISDDQLSDRVWEDINNWDYSWEDLSDYLSNIDTGYDYYYTGDGGYRGLGDWDFEQYRDEVLEWADDHEVWDDDLDDCYSDSEEDEEDEEETPEESCTVHDLFNTSVSVIKSYTQAEMTEEDDNIALMMLMG